MYENLEGITKIDYLCRADVGMHHAQCMKQREKKQFILIF